MEFTVSDSAFVGGLLRASVTLADPSLRPVATLVFVHDGEHNLVLEQVEATARRSGDATVHSLVLRLPALLPAEAALLRVDAVALAAASACEAARAPDDAPAERLLRDASDDAPPPLRVGERPLRVLQPLQLQPLGMTECRAGAERAAVVMSVSVCNALSDHAVVLHAVELRDAPPPEDAEAAGATAAPTSPPPPPDAPPPDAPLPPWSAAPSAHPQSAPPPPPRLRVEHCELPVVLPPGAAQALAVVLEDGQRGAVLAVRWAPAAGAAAAAEGGGGGGGAPPPGVADGLLCTEFSLSADAPPRDGGRRFGVTLAHPPRAARMHPFACSVCVRNRTAARARLSLVIDALPAGGAAGLGGGGGLGGGAAADAPLVCLDAVVPLGDVDAGKAASADLHLVALRCGLLRAPLRVRVRVGDGGDDEEAVPEEASAVAVWVE